MKLQKLTIHNLASIEDAVIDFEAKPLSDSEVFLITGKTGAGKSTILDAICLALYANTPRFFNTSMEGKATDNNKEIQLDDPRQLLRRNTAEGFAELTFTGSNDVKYRAKWSIARAHNKVGGNLQAKEWELTNLNTNTTLNKEKEIKAEIQKAVGLGFDQFRRTTMLAQGEFTRFLDSKDDDKSVILEKITGASEYTEIGKKIFDITSEKKRDYDRANDKLDGIQTLDSTQIEEKTKEIETIEGEREELDKKKKADDEKLQWLRGGEELQKKETDAQADYDKIKAVVDGEDYKAKKKLVDDWNGTIDARNWLNSLTDAQKKEAEIKDQLITLADEFSTLRGGLEFSIEERGEKEQELKSLTTSINEQESKRPVYENAQSIAGSLKTITDSNDAISKQKKSIETEKATLNETLVPKHNAAVEKFNEENEKLTKQKKVLDDKEKKLEELNLVSLRSQRDEIVKKLNDIDSAEDKFKALTLAEDGIKERREKLNARREDIKKKQEDADGKKPEVETAKAIMDNCKKLLDAQKDTIDKFAKTLRSRLTVGSICPVCRQTINSEIPHEDDLKELVGNLQNAYDEAETNYNTKAEELRKLEAEITSETNSCKNELESIDTDKSVSTARKNLVDACTKVGIDIIDENIMDILSKKKEELGSKKKEINKKIGSAEEIDEEVKALRKTLDGQQTIVDNAKTAESEAKNKIDECNTRIKAAESVVESKKVDIKNAEDVIDSANIIVADWENDWHVSPKEFSRELTDSAKAYNDKVERRKSLENDVTTANNEIGNVTNSFDSITTIIPEWKKLSDKATVQIDNLLTKVNDLRQNVTTADTQLKLAEKSIKDNEKALGDFLSVSTISKERLVELSKYSTESISRETTYLESTKSDEQNKKTALDIARNNLKLHGQKAEELKLTDDDTEDNLVSRIAEFTGQISAFDQEIGAIRSELERDKEQKRNIENLQADADEKKSVYEKWERLNNLLGDAKGKTFRTIAQSYVLTSLIQAANSYMKTLTDRYTLKVKPGTFVISIEDAYQGYASRAASTISGGESFLVSLSLALALSDIGEQLQVDTLFIDEGFGTLSGEPLQKAVETLRSLHKKAGRHVGIISHVDELQERIPVQIQVNQNGNSSSSQVTIVP